MFLSTVFSYPVSTLFLLYDGTSLDLFLESLGTSFMRKRIIKLVFRQKAEG